MKRLIVCLALLLTASTAIAPSRRAFSGRTGFTAAGGGATPPGIHSSGKQVPVNAATISATAGPGGVNRGLFAFIGQGDPDPPVAVTSVTFNTTETMTAIPSFSASDGSFVHVQGYYLAAPSVASASIVVVMAGTVEQLSLTFVAVTNMHQTVFLGTAVPANGSGTTASTTVSSATSEIVLCTVMTDAVTITVGTGTELQSNENIASDTSHGLSWVAGGTSITPTWTLVDSQGWAISAVGIKGL